MNNEGFGLQELLVFIGIFLFTLVAITIYGNAKLGNDSFYEKPDVKVQEEDINKIEPTTIEIPKEYISLENKLKNAAKQYSFDKSQNTIITLKELQNNNLIGKLVDPNDKTVLCDGYVIYSNNNYKSYINCSGMYITESYDNELVN